MCACLSCMDFKQHAQYNLEPLVSDSDSTAHKMEAHPYDFDTSLSSFVIGFGSFKSRQKAVMDVDCMTSVPGTEV